MNLGLDHDEDLPRRLLLNEDVLLAYGGDDGSIVKVVHGKSQELRAWDADAVRCVLLTATRALVGLDSGQLFIYVYDDEDKKKSDDKKSGDEEEEEGVTENTENTHPFASDFGHTRDRRSHETIWSGPTADAPIRDLRHLQDNLIGVATESGWYVLDISTSITCTQPLYQSVTADAHAHGGIAGLAVMGNHITALGMDGRPMHWKLSNDNGLELLHSGTKCFVQPDVGELLGASVWERSRRPTALGSHYFGLPGSHQPIVCDLQGERLESTSKQYTCDHIIQLASAPHNPNLLLAAAQDQSLSLWKIENNTVQFLQTLAWTPDAGPTDVLWTRQQLYVVTARGTLYTIELPAAILDMDAEAVKESVTDATKEKANNTSSSDQDDDDKDSVIEAHDSEDDDDDGPVVKARKSKTVSFIDDQAQDDDQGEERPMDPSLTAPSDDDEDADEDRAVTSPYTTTSLPEPQPAFAPSSSPLDWTRRFLCWNHVGSLTRHAGDRDTIDIQFTDAAFRRPVSFTDTQGFVVGSLGEDGALLASTSDDGNSTLYFYRYETFGALRDKDWYSSLSEGVLGCATGQGWAAVTTSRNFVRFYSSGGNQGAVHWLPGAPVTMAGRGRFLGVVYHRGSPLPNGTQQLGYQLWDVAASVLLTEGPLSCIGKGASLQWLGLDNEASLMAMDSDGMVSMLVANSSDESLHWSWVPMLDTLGLRKSSEDSHWPITVYDGKLVCVPLKGGTSYPDAARRPVTQSLNFRLPLANQTPALEELSVRASLALSHKKALEGDDDDDELEREHRALSAQVDKVTLKLFASRLEAGKVEGCLDLVERLYLEKSLDLAMTIANDHVKLVDLIQECKDRRFGSDDDDEASESWSATDGPVASSVSPDSVGGRKRTLDQEGDRSIRRKSVF